jgi:arginyl-tRNA synthetase
VATRRGAELEEIMLKQKLKDVLQKAADEAQRRELLPSIALPETTVERPQDPAHGDYACSFPLKVARAAGIKPLDIAKRIVGLIEPLPEIERMEVAAPGFINFTVKNGWLRQQVDHILHERDRFGELDVGKGTRVQLEFVSVNPTGPIHVGHGRGAVLGSALARILDATGFTVEKEYYINDAGGQIDVFRASLYARYQQALGISAEVPPDGYHGDYLIELAKEIVAEKGDAFASLSPDRAISELGDIGQEKMIASIKSDLSMLGVEFDVWFSEKSLYDGPQYEHVMSLLREDEHLAEREGAIWFVSSALGEDKDNVLVRSSGTPTYFASDIAYHYSKFVERGFDKVIDIWGADHHGHVPRMKAALSAIDIEPDRLEMILTQMVTLKRGGEEIKVSKRSGDLVTLREVVEEVGKDACRFFFLSRSANSQMDFDLELAKKQSNDNPVYYVQYAHARIAGILRTAQERGVDYSRGDVSLLTTAAELDLIRKMLQLPEVVETVATSLEPAFLPYYARELATAFHNFYERCRVVSEDTALTATRLKLVEASKTVLARCLSLMGMSAPEKM